MPRSTRLRFALVMLALGVVLNLIVLFSGDTSPGWPLAAVILLGASGVALLAERREP